MFRDHNIVSQNNNVLYNISIALIRIWITFYTVPIQLILIRGFLRPLYSFQFLPTVHEIKIVHGTLKANPSVKTWSTILEPPFSSFSLLSTFLENFRFLIYFSSFIPKMKILQQQFSKSNIFKKTRTGSFWTKLWMERVELQARLPTQKYCCSLFRLFGSNSEHWLFGFRWTLSILSPVESTGWTLLQTLVQ